jgi:hypothetical protein
VTANDNFFQQQKPAAVLKHSVLAEHTNVFTSSTGMFGSTVWALDGYSGPGVYADDREGQPPGGRLTHGRDATRTMLARIDKSA